MIPALVAGGIAAASIASNLYDSYKNRKNARDTYNSIRDAAENAVQQNQRDINAYAGRLNNAYGAGAASYSDALQNFLDSDVYQNDGFGYSGDIADFNDPSANQRVDAAMSALENSAATGGNRFSSDYQNRMAAKQQAMASEEWEKAYDRLMQDRNQQMSEWQANSANAWNNYNAAIDRAKYAVDTYGNDRDKLLQGYADTTTARMNNRLGGLQTQANVAGAKLGATQGPGTLSQILGPVAQFAGSYFGGGN